jgi:hypothetical protein
LSFNTRRDLGFVPKSQWAPLVFSLADLRQIYFTKRNGAARRFDLKLYNALCITKLYPYAYPCVGAIWISPTIMKVHSQTFGNLLGIHAIQGGLFHKQGNFSRHGFVQLTARSGPPLDLNLDLRDVDDYVVRLYMDQEKRFCRDFELVVTDDDKE